MYVIAYGQAILSSARSCSVSKPCSAPYSQVTRMGIVILQICYRSHQDQEWNNAAVGEKLNDGRESTSKHRDAFGRNCTDFPAIWHVEMQSEKTAAAA